MNNRYKIVISGRNLYKEIEISRDARQIKVGTGVDCDVRLHRGRFFEQIELLFVKNRDDWSVVCSDNLYLTEGDIRKLMTKSLRHGDVFEVKYNESDSTVFSVEFLIDFDDGRVKYERIVDISGCASVSIGQAPGSDIVISSPYVLNDSIKLVRHGSSIELCIYKAAYGVYHNGGKAKSGEEIRNGDFFNLSDFFFCYNNGRLLMQIRDGLRVNGLHFTDSTASVNYPRFSRSTRIKQVVNDKSIPVLAPPTKPEKPKTNLLTRLLPSCGLLLTAVVMAAMGSTRMLIFSGISGGMAIITAIIGMREGKKDFETRTAERIEKYNAYVDRKRQEIAASRAEEHDTLEQIYISQEAERRNFDDFSPMLFDRRPDDDDFLSVRLGVGRVEARRALDYRIQEKLEIEDDLQLIPEQMCDEYKYIERAPVICRLADTNAVGIVGSEFNRFTVMKNIVVDIAARQYYSDVSMVFVAAEEHADRINWLRMLPNVYSDAIGRRLLVCDDESKNVVFEYLYKELSLRRQTKGRRNNIIVFLYDEYGFKNHPISKFIDEAKELGVCFVFFGDRKSEIPMGCSFIIDILDGGRAALTDTSDSSKTCEFDYPRISDENAARIVRILAPVYTEEISLEGTLTKNISMFQMLNILAVDDIDLKANWERSQVFKSMSAPIGVSKNGIVYLDLHDKAHGPHGLVAGTTGSGKSEVLQTYILSMAILFHPYEVGFVIIDFKGGGMVNQFRELPHLVGAITNIDGREIDRSLKSIKAELRKRQRYFAEADVNHIDKYIKKYKAGEVSRPLPHLIIIVDEFAELKAEQPEFMKELISTARIGRSLGVHLILATQKPSGQVNEQIWSNSRFKLCLKVQSQEDSNEVLKSPLAAEIKEPGRAYLQVGNNEIFELFQSAYSGAPEKQDMSNLKEFSIFSLSKSGKKTPVYVQKKSKSAEDNATQLDAIVGYVRDYFSAAGLSKLPNICLPALEKRIPFPAGETDSGMQISIGIYDAPEMQYQGKISLPMLGNTIMIGSTQTGKTNLLQTVVRAVAASYTPQEVNIYIADCGSMLLRSFDGLRHVGGVACANEEEKVRNLFKMLTGEIDKRKNKLIKAGVSSFASYIEAGEKDMPLIMLLIDNVGLLRELYMADSDALLNICREGVAVGISVVATALQSNGISYKYLSSFDYKLAFYCNDPGEYSFFFGSAKIKPDNNPGRCIFEQDKEMYEGQIFQAFEGEKEYQRVAGIKSFIAETNAKYADDFVRQIPVIPDILSFDSLAASSPARKECWLMGLDYESIQPVYIDLAKEECAGIVASDTDTQRLILGGLFASVERYAPETAVYLADGMGKVLADFAGLPFAAAYGRGAAQHLEILNTVVDEAESRYRLGISGDADVSTLPLVLLVADAREFNEAVCGDRAALDKFRQLTGKYKNMRICVVLTGMENVRVQIMGSDVLKWVRDNGSLVLSGELQEVKVTDVMPSSVKRFKGAVKENDVFIITSTEIRKVKCAGVSAQ